MLSSLTLPPPVHTCLPLHSRLDDFENACSAYEKAIEMESDHLFHLNYAITLYNNEEAERAQTHFLEFETLFAVRALAR